MGNCSTVETLEAETSEAETSTAETFTAETSTAEVSVILFDEVTGKEYRIMVENQKDTVWSTVNKECNKRGKRAKKITYGGTEVFETQTWEQLGIADDATVIVETEKKQETCQCNTVWSYNHPNMVL